MRRPGGRAEARSGRLKTISNFLLNELLVHEPQKYVYLGMHIVIVIVLVSELRQCVFTLTSRTRLSLQMSKCRFLFTNRAVNQQKIDSYFLVLTNGRVFPSPFSYQKVPYRDFGC